MNPASFSNTVPSNSTLTIGIVTETYPPEINGVARTLARLIQNMSERGHRVHLVRPRQRKEVASDAYVLSTTLVAGVPIPWYRSLRAGWPSVFKLQRLWRETPPDVLYVATEGPLGLAAVMVARQLGIPVVSGFHTNFPSYTTHYRMGFLKPLILGYLRYFHNRTASTLVPTDELRNGLTREGFQGVEVVGRGVDLELFAPERRSDKLRRKWGVRDDQPVLLYVGRLATEKNIELALRCYDAMLQHNPDLRFVLVGDGPIRAELAKTRKELIFAGEKRGKRLARHFASADIFLFPSETETFGNVTLEALASGLALVAFDYAAAREVGKHGHNGLFVPLGDHEAYIEASCQLARDAGLIATLKVNARQTVQSCGWNRIYDRFETTLLQQLQPDIVAEPLGQGAGQ